MSGIFHDMSLLNFAPQFQQTGSTVWDIRLHLGQGRRGAVVSRPHQLQICEFVAPPQNGHTTAPGPPAGGGWYGGCWYGC